MCVTLSLKGLKQINFWSNVELTFIFFPEKVFPLLTVKGWVAELNLSVDN